MKLGDFEARLDADLSWRKKEISDLYILAQENKKDVLLKSIILLVYAHWEGFIKNSSKLYLKHVSDEKILIKELANNFHAIDLKKYIKVLKDNCDVFSIHQELDFLDRKDSEGKKFKVKIDLRPGKGTEVIDTENNLKEEILKRIFKTLGLKYKSSLQTKKVYIDHQLLKNRNIIAHGDIFDDEDSDEFSLTIEDISKLKNIIFFIMGAFKEDLSMYASRKFYLRSNQKDMEAYEVSREAYLDKEFKKLEQ